MRDGAAAPPSPSAGLSQMCTQSFSPGPTRDLSGVTAQTPGFLSPEQLWLRGCAPGEGGLTPAIRHQRSIAPIVDHSCLLCYLYRVLAALPLPPQGVLRTDFVASDLFCCHVSPVPASRQTADTRPSIHSSDDLFRCQKLQGFQLLWGSTAATRRRPCSFKFSLTSVQAAPKTQVTLTILLSSSAQGQSQEQHRRAIRKHRKAFCMLARRAPQHECGFILPGALRGKPGAASSGYRWGN